MREIDAQRGERKRTNKKRAGYKYGVTKKKREARARDVCVCVSLYVGVSVRFCFSVLVFIWGEGGEFSPCIFALLRDASSIVSTSLTCFPILPFQDSCAGSHS